tara:strand:- start:24 stop:380 length:357 start_codon:yes stop_codon:yes gene_type:complete
MTKRLLQEREETYRLKRDLMNVICTFSLDENIHVPDMLTRIRVLPTIAVVGQKSKVERVKLGAARLNVYVKFLPEDGGVLDNLKKLGGLLKTVPGIKSVKFLSVGGKPVTVDGNPIVV